jgi:hypothetical protein
VDMLCSFYFPIVTSDDLGLDTSVRATASLHNAGGMV